MIIEGLFNVFFGFINFIISLLPVFDTLQIPNNLLVTFLQITNLCGYFLPITDLFIIFGLWLAVVNGQFIYSLIMRIWDALPFT